VKLVTRHQSHPISRALASATAFLLGLLAVTAAAGAAEKAAPAAKAAPATKSAPAAKSASASPEKSAPGNPPRLLDTRMIYDDSGHNAFTSLVRFNDEFVCAFRVGGSHLSPEGKIRVIKSDSGLRWESVGLMGIPEADLRDPKLVISPRGRLMLYAAAATTKPGGAKAHQTMVWQSKEDWQWGEGKPVGETDFWLWRVTWHGDAAYGVGYGTRDDNKFVRLYSSPDGVNFTTLVPKLAGDGYPNEAGLLFLEDKEQTALCLLRRDEGTKTGLLGTSRPPYKEWTWKDTGTQVGAPAMIQVPDGRIVAAVRLYDKATRTSLCWVDAKTGKLTECLRLQSGGDTSYAGLVWHDNLLWVSYYSTHEGKTSVYLAQVTFEAAPPF
jgi:hypothetical protein